MYCQDYEDPVFSQITYIVPSVSLPCSLEIFCLFWKKMCKFHYNQSARISVPEYILAHFISTLLMVHRI